MQSSSVKTINTIKEAREWGCRELAGRAERELDCDLLLGAVLGLGRVELISQANHALEHSEIQAFAQLINRRKLGEPVAYILGKREFWGLEFEVTPATLVPRPETEHLVERGITLASEIWSATKVPVKVLDLGTGSGCIIIALAYELERLNIPAELVAVDISQAALEVAERNAARLLHKGRVLFIESNLFSNLASYLDHFNIILSNPPYIAHDESNLPIELSFEPSFSLFAEDEGLAVIKRIVSAAPDYISANSPGKLLIEIGSEQGSALVEYVVKASESDMRIRNTGLIHRDLAGLERVLEIEIINIEGLPITRVRTT